MKTSFSTIAVLTLAFSVAGLPSVWADAGLQNGSPGAQGTEGTNPTHQDQSVTGPNGEHSTNSNPASEPTPVHKKKHHKKSCSNCSTNGSSSSM
jgi:hypothetical protein